MDATTEELRHAHDALAELYADKLAHILDQMPVERAVLGLFCDLLLENGVGSTVGDIGCGPGRLAPYLAGRGLEPHGVDLSPEMIRVARRDYPRVPFDVADMRSLPFEDSSLAGVVCWYSLMYLAPSDRPQAFDELARVVRPGGYFATAFKTGDDQVRRGGRAVGVEFDIYWHPPACLDSLDTDGDSAKRGVGRGRRRRLGIQVSYAAGSESCWCTVHGGLRSLCRGGQLGGNAPGAFDKQW